MAAINMIKLMGRVKKTVGSPRDISIARRKYSSNLELKMNPNISGIGSKPSFIKMYPSNPNTAVSTTEKGLFSRL